jgi:hypothetical protein
MVYMVYNCVYYCMCIYIVSIIVIHTYLVCAGYGGEETVGYVEVSVLHLLVEGCLYHMYRRF